MLGREIQDPDGIEEKRHSTGIGVTSGLHCIWTGKEKNESRRKIPGYGRYSERTARNRFNGYEIHMGRSEVDTKSDRLVSMREEGNEEPQRYHEDGPRTEMSMAVMYMVFLMKNWCQKELFLLY